MVHLVIRVSFSRVGQNLAAASRSMETMILFYIQRKQVNEKKYMSDTSHVIVTGKMSCCNGIHVCLDVV